MRVIGGRADIEKVTTQVTKLSFTVSNGERGLLEVFAKAPNKSLAVVKTLEGQVVNRYGFDGTVGWDWRLGAGTTRLSGSLLAATRRDAEFYWQVKLRELFPTMVFKGKTTSGDRQVYVIEAMPADGLPRTMYFDMQNGLLARRDDRVELPGVTASIEFHFGDYRQVDGIKLPFAIRRVTPGGEITLTMTEARHNVPIDDALFEIPKPD